MRFHIRARPACRAPPSRSAPGANPPRHRRSLAMTLGDEALLSSSGQVERLASPRIARGDRLGGTARPGAGCAWRSRSMDRAAPERPTRLRGPGAIRPRHSATSPREASRACRPRGSVTQPATGPAPTLRSAVRPLVDERGLWQRVWRRPVLSSAPLASRALSYARRLPIRRERRGPLCGQRRVDPKLPVPAPRPEGRARVVAAGAPRRSGIRARDPACATLSTASPDLVRNCSRSPSLVRTPRSGPECGSGLRDRGQQPGFDREPTSAATSST